MTRDEFYATLKQATEYGRSTVPVRLAYDQLVAHDAEQRRVIEQQTQQIATLREELQAIYDIKNGCPLPMYQKDWDRAMERVEQLLKEHP